VPFKLNQDRRHHIPKQKHKVTNWREYDASLRQLGSLTMWVTPEALAAWHPPKTGRPVTRVLGPGHRNSSGTAVA